MPAGRTLRVVHLMHGWNMGGLEQLVLELATLGRARDIEPLIVSFGPDGPIREAAAARGLPTRWIRAPGMSLAAWRAMRTALDEFDADLLHAHDEGPWLNAAAVRALRPRTRVVVTFHQMQMPTGPKLHAARLAARVTSAVVACGGEVRDQLAGWVPFSTRVRTIGNGVRLPAPASAAERASARARLGIPEQAIAFGYLGRMAPIKGPDLLLEAFLASFAGRDDVHLALVGPGELEASLRARAQGHANVHLPGTIVNASALLPAFDVYAQTSVSEGRSLAMLEAMAAGLPTVAHELPGVREIHPDGTTARLVPLRDAGALQAALRTLADDAGLRARLGEAARRASHRYSIDATMDAYASLYDELVGESGLSWASAP